MTAHQQPIVIRGFSGADPRDGGDLLWLGGVITVTERGDAALASAGEHIHRLVSDPDICPGSVVARDVPAEVILCNDPDERGTHIMWRVPFRGHLSRAQHD
jgi:hypothetical protein